MPDINWPPDQPIACTRSAHCWWCGVKKLHRISIYSVPDRKHPTILLCGDCLKMLAELPEGTHIGIWSDQP